MTQKDIAIFIAKMKSYFPASFAKKTAEDAKRDVIAWYELFQDYPKDVLFKALKDYVRENDTPFSPAPGQLFAIIQRQVPQNTDVLDKYEAWALVEKALRNGGDGYQEEYNKLPPLVQRAVGSCRNIRQWSLMAIEQVIWVKKDFLAHYEELAKQEEMKNKLPENILPLLKGNVQIEMPKGEDE